MSLSQTPTQTPTPSISYKFVLIDLCCNPGNPVGANVPVEQPILNRSGIIGNLCFEITIIVGDYNSNFASTDVFTINSCEDCQLIHPCPTLTPTETPTQTVTPTVTSTVTITPTNTSTLTPTIDSVEILVQLCCGAR